MHQDISKDNTYSLQSDIDEAYWNSLITEGEFTKTNETLSEEFLDYDENLLFNGQESSSHYYSIDSSEKDWQDLQVVMDDDEVLELKVTGYNRGGLLVEWRSLRGFVPASQLIDFPADNYNQQKRHDALVQHIGTMLRLRIIEIDKDKNRLILSERAAQVKVGTREQIFETLQTGDIVSGQVTNLCDFGVFIDLGGVEGLIHISELSWGRVGHPEDVLKRDETVHVYVLDIDPEQARIALSLKRLNPDPWATIEQRYQTGEIVEGRITNVVDFGAFACIENGLEGLIHFSELAEGHFLHPRNVVSEGEFVKARILSIDGRARRLGLSLRLV